MHLTPQCDAHRGVNCTKLLQKLCSVLCGVLPTVETDSVESTSKSFQVSGWSRTRKKRFEKKFGFAKSKILTLQCDAHRGVEFFNLCDQISWRNRN